MAKCANLVDFHNHVIPGVDDGAPDIRASRDALAEMHRQGVSQIIATPHLRASMIDRPEELGSYLDRIAAAFGELTSLSVTEFPGLSVYRGFEILLDIPNPNLTDPLLRLAGSRFTLVEFPFLDIPPNSDTALFELKLRGWQPIVAHPERYRDIQRDPARVDKWRHVGAYLQANAGSFLGRYGREAERTAWTLLETGAISYICSDYHAVGSCDSEKAFAVLAARFGDVIAETLFATNPGKILESSDPLPVAPRQKKRSSFLTRLGLSRFEH